MGHQAHLAWGFSVPMATSLVTIRIEPMSAAKTGTEYTFRISRRRLLLAACLLAGAIAWRAGGSEPAAYAAAASAPDGFARAVARRRAREAGVSGPEDELLRVSRRAEALRPRHAHARDDHRRRRQWQASSFRTSPSKSRLYLYATTSTTRRCRRRQDFRERISRHCARGSKPADRSRASTKPPARRRTPPSSRKAGRAADQAAGTRVLGVQSRRCARRCRRRRPRAGTRNPIDAFLAAAMEAKGAEAVGAGRSAHAHPPRLSRRARPAADARRGRGVRRRQVARRRGRKSSIACSRRRTTASAGRGTGWIWSATPIPKASSSTSTAAEHVSLSRLPGRGVQQGQAVRPVHQGAARRRRIRAGSPTRR